jgi:hypothetical protein
MEWKVILVEPGFISNREEIILVDTDLSRFKVWTCLVSKKAHTNYTRIRELTRCFHGLLAVCEARFRVPKVCSVQEAIITNDPVTVTG